MLMSLDTYLSIVMIFSFFENDHSLVDVPIFDESNSSIKCRINYAEKPDEFFISRADTI